MKLLNLIPTKAMRLLSLCILPLGVLLSISSAQSAGFGVIVVDEYGAPMSDASVCFGLPGTPDQFGVYTTEADGRVIVNDLPRVPLSVTVSKQDYQGIHFQETLKSFRLVKTVTLLLDGEGPICKSKSKIPYSSLRISNLFASRDGNKYLIESRISGDPTHYRISSREDFKGARWTPYKTAFNFGNIAAKKDTLYFQVRRYSKTNRSWIEARSNVSQINVN